MMCGGGDRNLTYRGWRWPAGASLALWSEVARIGSTMAWIPDGVFRMGSARFYPEERPVHRARVDLPAPEAGAGVSTGRG